MFTWLFYNLNGYRVYEYLLKEVMPKRFTTSQRHYLAQRAKPFMLKKGMLYRIRQDNMFYRILQLE
jgi:hypothetical protein